MTRAEKSENFLFFSSYFFPFRIRKNQKSFLTLFYNYRIRKNKKARIRRAKQIFSERETEIFLSFERSKNKFFSLRKFLEIFKGLCKGKRKKVSRSEKRPNFPMFFPVFFGFFHFGRFGSEKYFCEYTSI